MAKQVLSFKQEKETSGAVRFQETNDKGEILDRETAKVGTLYVRKSTFNGSAIPATLKMTLEF